VRLQLCLLLLALPCILRGQSALDERPTVGFVRSINGEWEMRVGRRTEQVKRGQALPAGAELRPRSRQSNPTIEIVRAHDVNFLACADARGVEICNGTFKVPDIPGPASLSARIKAAFSRYFSAEVTYAKTMVRGSAVLQDGVAVLQEGRVDVSRVLTRVPQGRYRLRLTPRASTGSVSIERVVDWAPSTSGDFPAPSTLTPGMYSLTLPELREGCWVLIAAPLASQKAESALSELEAVTEAWLLNAVEKNGLRRALLEQLAQELPISER